MLVAWERVVCPDVIAFAAEGADTGPLVLLVVAVDAGAATAEGSAGSTPSRVARWRADSAAALAAERCVTNARTAPLDQGGEASVAGAGAACARRT